MDEFALIDWIHAQLGGDRRGIDGIGDDAALLRPTDGRLICVDTMLEGVHFRTDWTSWADAGFKLYARNLSDIQAMGGTPTVFLLTLAVPSPAVAQAIVQGVAQAIAALSPGVLCIGGDSTRSRGASMMTLTLLGELQPPVLSRADARSGQGVWCNGPLGWASAAVALLESGAPVSSVPDALLQAHARPRPVAISAAERETGGITACIDVSDGLDADAAHLARASGVRLVLDGPFPGCEALAVAAERLGTAPEVWQRTGGDDYVKLVTADRCPGPGWTCVGRVVPEVGLTLPQQGGTPKGASGGYRHFEDPAGAPAAESGPDKETER
jgi:thiamine-monophosphate kinase